MGKRIFRIIGYLVLMGINIWLLWFFHNFLNLAILTVMVFLPVFSILLTKWVIRRLETDWEGPYESMSKGETFYMQLKIRNRTWLGIMNCKLLISVSNLFYGTVREHEIRVPIRAKKGQTITYPVTVSKCGMIEFTVHTLLVEDFLGFVAFRTKPDSRYVISVLPNTKSDLSLELNAYMQGMTEVEESTKKGTDFSEVQDIREYQPGDKMQNIHWKLSVKKDLLMVKERVSMSSRQLFLLMELHDNENGLMEEILDCGYGIVRFMLQHQFPVSLIWWSEKNQELMTYKVDYEEQLEEGFRMIYYESLYADQMLGKEMFQAVRGSETQFLWIGNRNFGSGESLLDYGLSAGVFYGILS